MEFTEIKSHRIEFARFLEDYDFYNHPINQDDYDYLDRECRIRHGQSLKKYFSFDMNVFNGRIDIFWE